MLEKYIPVVQCALSTVDMFHPLARLYYSSKTQMQRTNDKVWGNIIGIGGEGVEEVLMGVEDIVLGCVKCKEYENVGNKGINDDKIRVVVHVDSLNDEVLGNLNKETLGFLEISLVVFGEESQERKKGVSTVFSSNREEVLRNFGATSVPFAVVTVGDRLIWKGSFTGGYLEKWKKSIESFNRFEALALISQSKLYSLELYSHSEQRVKRIDISIGRFLIEILDEHTEDTYLDIETIRILVTPKVLDSGYSFPVESKERIMNDLRIFELPTVFLVENGQVVWRGNPIFESIPGISETNNELGREELLALQRQFKEKAGELSRTFPNIDLELQVCSVLDITHTHVFTEKSSLKLTCYVSQREEPPCLALYKELRTNYPSLKIEIVMVDLFPTAVGPINSIRHLTVSTDGLSSEDSKRDSSSRGTCSDCSSLIKANKELESQLVCLQQYFTCRQNNELSTEHPVATEDLQSQNTELLKEKARMEESLLEMNRTVKNYLLISKKIKVELGENEKTLNKRDSQLFELLEKIQSQEHQILSLNSSLAKQRKITKVQETEINVLKESSSPTLHASKRNSITDELLRQITSKDSEIQSLREVVKSIKSSNSTVKLPPLKDIPSPRVSSPHLAFHKNFELGTRQNSARDNLPKSKFLTKHSSVRPKNQDAQLYSPSRH